MRPSFAGDDLLERIGLRMNLAPVPVAHAFFGMPTARVVGLAARLGVFGALLDRWADAEQTAEDLGLRPAGTRMMLECLAGMRLLAFRDGRFRVHRRARRWLDPESPRYIGTFLEHTLEYWDWWGNLEGVLRDGDSVGLHDRAPEDPSWGVYIRGQYELARQSASEVARALRLVPRPASILDVAGGHGWFAAALCQRHPTLSATVIDLPASAAVGRQIMAETGMSDRVRVVDGDMFEADLGGPHDGALCFDIIHHLPPDRTVALLERIRAALKPGATLAVLDMFRSEGARPRASAGAFRLFFHLTSGADIYSADELAGLLGRAGFGPPRHTRIKAIPDQALYQASAEPE